VHGNNRAVQAFAALAIGLVLALFLGVVVGLTWFLAVPIGILFLVLAPMGYAAMAGRHGVRRTSGALGASTSTASASYEPASDPLDRYRQPE
jgi:4-hydroxybenzoate polyprenyltransferase